MPPNVDIPTDLVDSLDYQSPHDALLALANESEQMAAKLAERLAHSMSPSGGGGGGAGGRRALIAHCRAERFNGGDGAHRIHSRQPCARTPVFFFAHGHGGGSDRAGRGGSGRAGRGGSGRAGRGGGARAGDGGAANVALVRTPFPVSAPYFDVASRAGYGVGL